MLVVGTLSTVAPASTILEFDSNTGALIAAKLMESLWVRVMTLDSYNCGSWGLPLNNVQARD